MKITNEGPVHPLVTLAGLIGGSTGPGPDGQVPTANGSNGIAWGSNVAIITSNGSNALIGPFVNFASGAGIAFAAASNTLTISSTVTSGGGGGGGSSDFVSGAAGTLQIVIPGLAGSPDIRVGGGSDDEFDATDTSDPMTGWTTLGTPTSHNINSQAKSHYYVKRNASASVALAGIYKAWSPSAGNKVTCKLAAWTVDVLAATWRAALFVGETSPGKIASYGRGDAARDGLLVDLWTNPTTFASTPNNTGSLPGDPVYLRIVYNSSTSLDYQFSFDGLLWWTQLAANNPSFTVGSAGLCVNPKAAGAAVEALFDWIRFT